MTPYTEVWNELYGQTRREIYEAPRRSALSTLTVNIKAGNIEKEPCLICTLLPVIPYFVDYDDPLDVVWLCRLHHVELLSYDVS